MSSGIYQECVLAGRFYSNRWVVEDVLYRRSLQCQWDRNLLVSLLITITDYRGLFSESNTDPRVLFLTFHSIRFSVHLFMWVCVHFLSLGYSSWHVCFLSASCWVSSATSCLANTLQTGFYRSPASVIRFSLLSDSSPAFLYRFTFTLIIIDVQISERFILVTQQLKEKKQLRTKVLAPSHRRSSYGVCGSWCVVAGMW